MNYSECATCSGFGVCNDVECVCAVASSGPFSGKIMIKGSQCNQIRQLDSLGVTYYTIGIAITVVSLFVCVIGIIFYIVKRKHVVVKAGIPR